VLPASEALSDLIRRKASRDLFTGMEVSDSSHKNRSIFMDQELFASETIPVKLKATDTLLHEPGRTDPPNRK
jgi:hypothetical protein